MPELPEVEIVKRGLQSKIVGKKIRDVEIINVKLFQGDKGLVEGSSIESIERRAKMIIVNSTGDYLLLIHLKMTGQLIYDTCRGDKTDRVFGGHPSADWVADLPNKFTHVIFNFTDGGVLYFNDLRQFGYIKLIKKDDLGIVKAIKELGPEPYDERLTPEYLMSVFAKRPRVKIKQLLLDQTVIAGVGNIYADESLFCAGISPLRVAKDITRVEIVKLIDCIIKVIDFALENGGSSENTFVHVDGGKGSMQNFFKVYRQTGLKCPNGCGRITRIVVGGRGTHYCPICQK
jgi:formamidopyrimidine-DNA glycosylase